MEREEYVGFVIIEIVLNVTGWLKWLGSVGIEKRMSWG